MKATGTQRLLAAALSFLCITSPAAAQGQAQPAPAAGQAKPAAGQAKAAAGKTQPAASSQAGQAGKDDPDPWPRVLEGEKYLLKMYPPQVDSWEGRRLEAHSAVAVEDKAKAQTFYGAVELSARTRVDKEARMVVIDAIKAERAAFPSAPEHEAKLLEVLQQRLAETVKVVSLDRLETALAVVKQAEAAGNLPVKNDPPRIVFSQRPAMLIYVDGEPVFRAVEGTSYERLLNTRPLVLRTGGTHYLHLFDGWLAAPSLTGPWKVAKPPAGIDAALKKSMEKQRADLLDGGSGDAKEVGEDGKPLQKPTLAKGPVPDIIVALAPTELVVFEGEPEWAAIPGTRLAYVTNTSGNVFRLTGTRHLVLLSGRWFEAASLDGPWSYVPQDKLAKDFQAIPDDSPKENVKASVAGTPQSAEAQIANSIPETSEVKRAEAKLQPTYDGEPKWEAIPETQLSYAVNSPTPVIRVAADQYYAVQNGVWFVAPAASGPWIVAVQVPAAIYAIPPSSPVHYVTYVKVYDSDADSVVVGYTPGYYGTVVSDDVVIYGTGYAYTPWVGSYWWGPPVTWGYGCGIAYTPWGGWAYAFGVGWAWGHWGGWYAPYPGPWWGAYGGWGYYGGAAVGPGGGWAAWGPGGWAGTTGNVYRQWGSVSSVSRYSGGYNAWTGNAWRSQVGGAYNSRTGTIAAGQRGGVANIYTGEYAYGSRGVAHNTRTGTTVGGSRVTFGDADTGRQGTAGRVGAYNPRTGQGGSAAWVRGEEGGVARIGDDFYASKDGNVYRRDGRGDWNQADRSGQWKGVQDTARTRDLSRQSSARQMGTQRYQGQRMSSPRPRGGGGRRR